MVLVSMCFFRPMRHIPFKKAWKNQPFFDYVKGERNEVFDKSKIVPRDNPHALTISKNNQQ